MRECRITVADLIEGDTVITIGRTEVNARYRATEPCRVGQRVSGPRGGSYKLNAHGARTLVTVRTSKASACPIVPLTARAVVLRAEVQA
jgi:hypothetical protein